MAEQELESLLARMPEIAAAVNAFNSEAVQQEAFKALVDSMGLPSVRTEASDQTTPPPRRKAPAKKEPSGRRTGGKKQAFDLLKDLDVYKAGSPTLAAFHDEKKPSSQVQRVTLFVYWLSRTAGISPVTVNHVYTCYRGLSRPVPADLVNTLQKAGSEGWLDTSNRDDLRLVVGGENLIDHELPATNQ